MSTTQTVTKTKNPAVSQEEFNKKLAESIKLGHTINEAAAYANMKRNAYYGRYNDYRKQLEKLPEPQRTEMLAKVQLKSGRRKKESNGLESLMTLLD